MSYEGKVALVTGAASGMGRLTCERLCEQQWKVMAVDMEAEGLLYLEDKYDNVTTARCDVSNFDDVSRVVERTTNELGDIDRLVHCAAIMPLDSIAKMPTDLIVRQMRINYEGTVFAVKSVLPGMLERNAGDIISFGSIAGEVPLPEAGAYCASKAATHAFIKQLIYETENTNLRIRLICPPPVNTTLLSEQKTGKKFLDDRQKEVGLKLGTIVQPEFILDSIDRSLGENKNLIFPGYFAKLVVFLYRLLPTRFGRVMANYGI